MLWSHIEGLAQLFLGRQTTPSGEKIPSEMPQAALCFDKVTDQDPGSGSGIQTRRKRRSRRRGRGKRSVDVNGNVIGNHDLDWDKESFEKTSRDTGEQKGRHQMGHRGECQIILNPNVQCSVQFSVELC